METTLRDEKLEHNISTRHTFWSHEQHVPGELIAKFKALWWVLDCEPDRGGYKYTIQRVANAESWYCMTEQEVLGDLSNLDY